MKLLVKIPSRSRPAQLVETVRQFVRNARNLRDLSFVISMDEDDMESVNRARNMLGGIRGVDVRVGRSKSKVEAINRDLDGAVFDVMIVAADDQVPMPGYDVTIASEFQRRFPNFDGALHFDDGHTHDKLNTIPVIGYNLFRKFGYVYHPAYVSLWCDNEYTDMFRAMNRLPYIPDVMIRHNHPSYTGRPADALLARNESFYGVDEETYKARKAIVRPESLWGFDSPDVLLSILIPSLTQRHRTRLELFAELNRQINAHPERRRVEMWTLIDAGQAPVGLKRNALLKLSKGRFVCFVDDDDMVAPTYIEDIVGAILKDVEVDCIGLEGIITESGGNPRKFIHSIKCGGYYEKDNVFYRTPNHLNPIKHGHAKEAEFPSQLSFGEDREYATRLANLGRLKRETMIDKPLYYYRFDAKQSATQRRR